MMIPSKIKCPIDIAISGVAERHVSREHITAGSQTTHNYPYLSPTIGVLFLSEFFAPANIIKNNFLIYSKLSNTSPLVMSFFASMT